MELLPIRRNYYTIGCTQVFNWVCKAIEHGKLYSWRGSPSVAAIHICNKPV
jgi:hypothetical protein